MFLILLLLYIKNSNQQEKLYNYPYIVGIGFIITDEDVQIDVNICTGSLVQINWVVTAGDCIAEEKHYFVSFVTYKDGAPIVNKTEVTERFLHPGFKRPTFHTNIGLITVVTVDMPILPKLSLHDYSRSSGLPVVYIGFWTKADGSKNDRLEIGKFVICPCGSLTKNVICTRNEINISISYNWFTVGGALLHEGTLIGLYIGKVNQYIGRFLAINVNYHWINQIIQEDMTLPRLSVAVSLDFDEKRR